MTILYHGTNQVFERPNVDVGRDEGCLRVFAVSEDPGSRHGPLPRGTGFSVFSAVRKVRKLKMPL